VLSGQNHVGLVRRDQVGIAGKQDYRPAHGSAFFLRENDCRQQYASVARVTTTDRFRFTPVDSTTSTSSTPVPEMQIMRSFGQALMTAAGNFVKAERKE
jgi:hypothetical protein